MANFKPSRHDSKHAPYRLTFEGTRKKKWAYTFKQAKKDAQYWLSFGQMKVCIDQRLPSGTFRPLRCVTRS